MQMTTNTSEVLPGLAIRARLALARVKRTIDHEAGLLELEAVWDEAYEAGHDAFLEGRYCASKLIAGDPFLLGAWHAGQDGATKAIVSPIPF